jgi:sugar O-acyltransferase (sialic acid O-acetyltransferase NeuD family)
MSALLVVGAGGHGRVVADAATTMGTWQTISFVDDRPGMVNPPGFEIVGTSADLERLAKSHPDAVVAIGDAVTRLHLIQRCAEFGFDLPVIVHRSAAVSASASIGAGSVVFAQAVVNPGTTLGRGCIVNTGATVDHDCHLEEGVHACPGVHLAGNVRVGARTWIGIGACVKQDVRIGHDVIIGAGAAVISDVESELTVMGVPARVRQGIA